MEHNDFIRTPAYTNAQLTVLVILRMLIGWHFLYEGIVKFLNPYWSSVGYLLEAPEMFSEVFSLITDNPDVLKIVDFLNIWGLTAIGLCLILGLFTRTATIAGIVLLFLYYSAQPPLPGITYTTPSEGSYLIVNKNLIELFALVVLALFPTGKRIGIDRFIFLKRAAQFQV